VDQSSRFGKARVYIVRLRTDRHQARQGSGIQRCSRHQTDPVDNRVTDLVMRRPQKQVCVQPRPLTVNTALPAFAAERRAAAPCYRSSVDSQSATELHQRCSSAVSTGTDRRTHRRTDTVLLHRSCFAYYAGSTSCQQYHQQY